MLWQNDCTLDERCQIWYLVPIHIDGFHTIMRNTLGRDRDYDVLYQFSGYWRFISSMGVFGRVHGCLREGSLAFIIVWVGKDGRGRWSKVWNWSSVSRPIQDCVNKIHYSHSTGSTLPLCKIIGELVSCSQLLHSAPPLLLSLFTNSMKSPPTHIYWSLKSKLF